MATAIETTTRYITLDNLNRFLSNLQQHFKSSDKIFGGIKTGYVQDDTYRAVQLDESGKAYIKMPELKIPIATNNTLGGIMIGYNGGATDMDGNRPVQLDNVGKAFVNVPEATANTLGCIKIGYVDSSSTNAYKRFPLNLNNSHQAYIEIPYADIETSTCGLMRRGDYLTLMGHHTWFNQILGDRDDATGKRTDNGTLKRYDTADGKSHHYAIRLANDEKAIEKIGGIKLNYERKNDNDKNYPVELDEEGRAFVYVPWEAGEGGGEPVPDMISIKYADLLTKIKDEILAPGAKYRIIDFVTTIPEDYTQTCPKQFDILGADSNNKITITSAGHPFDIIVTALTEYSLSEDVKACIRENDDYFGNSNLDAWELKYCVKNDKTRFDWAVENGKGVIYYMKDEFGNECPYDFKNILYCGHYTFDVADANYEDEESKHLESFTSRGDASISTATRDAVALNNSISKYSLTYYGENFKNEPQTLNNIVCIFNNIYFTNFSNLSDLIISGNEFGLNCNNIILYMPRRNKFEENCSNIFIVGSGCSSNEFGKDCNNIYISYDYPDDKYYRDTYDDKTEMTPIIRIPETWDFLGAGESSYNKFGSNCNNFITNDFFSHNTFKNNCNHFEFGNNCRYNSVGANCSYFRFGDFFIKNTIADNNYKASYFINPNNESINDHTQRTKSFAGLYTRLDQPSSKPQAYKRIPRVYNCEFGPNSNIPIIIDHYNLLFGQKYNGSPIWNDPFPHPDLSPDEINDKSIENGKIVDEQDNGNYKYIFKNYKFINIQPQPNRIDGHAPVIIDVLKNNIESTIKEDIIKISSTSDTYINDDKYTDLDHGIHEYAAMDICNRDYITTAAGTTYNETQNEQQYISNNIYKLIDDLKQNSGTILPPSDDSGDNSEETVAIKELRSKCVQLERCCVVAFNDIIKSLSEKGDDKDFALINLAGTLGSGWNAGAYASYSESPDGDKLIPIFEENFGYGQLGEDGNPQEGMPVLAASFMTEEEFKDYENEKYPVSIYDKCATLERCCVATVYFILGELSNSYNNPLGSNRINPPINFSWNRFKGSGNEFPDQASSEGQYNADEYDWNALVPIFKSNRGWGRVDGGDGVLEAYDDIKGYGDRRNPDNPQDNRNYYVFYPDPNFTDYNGNDYGKDNSGVNP